MMSQETIDFVEDIVKTILSRWDNILIDTKDNMRDELMPAFISFVGAFVGEDKMEMLKNKQVIGIHLCQFFSYMYTNFT